MTRDFLQARMLARSQENELRDTGRAIMSNANLDKMRSCDALGCYRDGAFWLYRLYAANAVAGRAIEVCADSCGYYYGHGLLRSYDHDAAKRRAGSGEHAHDPLP